MTPIKMAVVGVGSMGRNHVRVLMDTHHVDLVGVADQHEEAARAVVQKYGVPVYTDYIRLFEECNPDGVVVAVPTVYHHTVAMAAIERGIHVLVEKPITATLEEARDLIEAAEKKGVILAVGHIERFNPAVVELKRRMDSGELGRIFMIHARRQSPFPRRIQDVGVASDLATHELDMMPYLAGSEVEKLSAEVKQVLHHSPREDIVFGLLRFQNGVLGILDVNWVTPAKVRELTITGERGMFVVNYLSQELYFYENPAAPVKPDNPPWVMGEDFRVDPGHMTRYEIKRREPLRSELEAFVEAIRCGTAPLVGGEDGLRALQLVEQVMGSWDPQVSAPVGSNV